MKKIPTLFKRVYNNGVARLTMECTEGCAWVFDGKGDATVKYDGACCAVIDGELYKRFDAKKGREIPTGAIPCGDADPITGHFPHWVKLDPKNNADKWYFKAFEHYFADNAKENWTYEAIGKHFNGNPYNLDYDTVVPHGRDIITDMCDVPRMYFDIRDYLRNHYIEGIVFWKDGEPRCKIKRTDFGFEWNGKTQKRG